LKLKFFTKKLKALPLRGSYFQNPNRWNKSSATQKRVRIFQTTLRPH
jgi:hypothetical protein